MSEEKVLLVDDEQDFLKALSERMQAKGLEITPATSGEEAVEAVKDEFFDAVVLDMMMPNLDGIETLKKIKEVNPDVQVILLTGHATVDKGIEAMKLGAMDFLEKPAELNSLMQKIKKAKVNKMLILEKKTEDRIKSILSEKGW
ncbi:MAG: response regulator [Desulfonatronovibrio sp.]